MGNSRYGRDVLAETTPRRRVPEVPAERDLVVEVAGSEFCGAVVACAAGSVTLEDRHGHHRDFPLTAAGFLLEGRPVTLVRPARTPPARAGRARTASGSLAVPAAPARVARASRIWVEGLHDAELVERVWGDDLRVAGVVVEPCDGVDLLPEAVRNFRPGPDRRLGVLVDHLVAGSKESRVVASLVGPHVLVTGHPYLDVWQAVRPASVGIPAWPTVPRGTPWKEGVCQALGVADPRQMWRRVLAGVRTYTDLEVPLLGAVERLIDFVTELQP
ncbi:MAG TPA: DUF3097 domain-containing protein [Mycobacteriales bacterium]|nr:DUF3097 domain-containing protein [Mycobacteriales bacterium]